MCGALFGSNRSDAWEAIKYKWYSCKQQLPALRLQIRMLGDEGSKDDVGQYDHGDNVFLKKIESHLLTQVGNDLAPVAAFQM